MPVKRSIKKTKKQRGGGNNIANSSRSGKRMPISVMNSYTEGKPITPVVNVKTALRMKAINSLQKKIDTSKSNNEWQKRNSNTGKLMSIKEMVNENTNRRLFEFEHYRQQKQLPRLSNYSKSM